MAGCNAGAATMGFGGLMLVVRVCCELVVLSEVSSEAFVVEGSSGTGILH